MGLKPLIVPWLTLHERAVVTRRLDAAKVLVGFVSFLRSALVLPLHPAGDAGDEVQRSCGEKLEFRPLQRAQRGSSGRTHRSAGVT